MKTPCHRCLVGVLLCAVVVLSSACDGAEEEPFQVEVTWYTGPAITPDATMLQWIVNMDEAGIVVFEEDTSGVGPPNRDVGTWRIMFLDVGASLPQFVSLTAQSAQESSVLVQGTVYIQDWDVHGVMSGEIKGEMRPGDPRLQPDPLVRFWVDMSQQ